MQCTFQQLKMNFLKIVFAASFFGMLSCVPHMSITLSTLTIDGKSRNGKIINRYPDYGDGQADGCVVMSEMKVDIQESDKFKNIAGSITDVETNEVLCNANITLKTINNKEIQAVTDMYGRFSIVSDARIISISVGYVGYRHFYASLR